ncbi:PQQ-dependent sugar dehydrogenase [Coralloluteibacterium thermophilus]|uniref:PQQ-dependent sugar dehydrogenase n=1 Tax=Coralloluteibacterium thermophilum TaxID=2707049 RepID=A0ABV9NPR2_9GAMM
MKKNAIAAACLTALLAACNAPDASNGATAAQAGAAAPAGQTAPATVAADGRPFQVEDVATFEEPWAMTFLPDGRLLVTEKKGALKVFDPTTGERGDVAGVPDVDYGGQGGFGDVVLHPQFAENGLVYISYAEAGEGDTRGGAVARARLELDGNGGNLADLEVIWRQVPKVDGRGHYGHRIAFDADGYLWITSSERQKFTPAQDMDSNLGKLVRLNDDGSVPADNPFVDQGEIASQVWSLGHRNMLGIDFDPEGRLWVHEMGPAGGDELNLIERGANYGYPEVSNGNHYDGREIPNHDTRPEFAAPAVTWWEAISPAGFVIYTGDQFPAWQGSGFIGGLSSQSLVRVEFDGTAAREAERFDMGQRIREVEQGPDGALWVLEDMRSGQGGRLLKLIPAG